MMPVDSFNCDAGTAIGHKTWLLKTVSLSPPDVGNRTSVAVEQIEHGECDRPLQK